MSDNKGDWKNKAQEDAKDAVEEQLDKIVNRVIDYKGKVNLNKGTLSRNFDTWLHEKVVNTLYLDLDEACEILTELEDYEETDRGVFYKDGDMKESFKGCAVNTYRNAVSNFIGEIIKRIEEDDALSETGMYEEPEEAAVAEKVKELIRQ